ncbi:hypothetical protein [Acetobacterium wieringae]|uniref:hypothetical protein n=1 Tax=Acetobacterium wieringae TaxID=52694 RepID=UPI003158F456
MTKAEHNKILEELFDQVKLGNFREDVILMAQMMAADFQLQLMQKLMAGLSPKHPAYPSLKAQVDVAVANFEKRVCV